MANHSPQLLRALRSHDFRLYFGGQLISLAGTWMQQIAMSWLAFSLTHSAFVLGLIGFASQLPILAFGGFGGVWSDRFDRRRVLMWTQSLAMIQALLIAGLAWQGWISAPVLVLLAFILGCINAMDLPARQSFVVYLVEDREQLPNAIALNSLLMNATRFVGPALAGFVVAYMGEAVCFLINAVSYLAVLVALRAIRVRAGEGSAIPALRALKEGFNYTFSHPDIRTCLMLIAAMGFLVTPYVVLMPMYAKDVFGGDASTFGTLISSAGAGSLTASLYLARRTSTRGLRRKVSIAAVISGAALAVFALNSRLGIAYPILIVLGFSVITTIAGGNTMIQTWVRDDMRGRVMATYSMAFLCTAPLGSLAAGSLAHTVGVRPTLFTCGVLAMLVGLAHAYHLRQTERLKRA
ncbi:MAG TPA: MFS transporter [Thiobacillaceae bacterium]|nr:MFS transporter [Thiobacillaceae bacterium]